MNTSDYTATIVVDQSPKEAFDAIINVRGWCRKISKEIRTNSMLSSRINIRMFIAAE